MKNMKKLLLLSAIAVGSYNVRPANAQCSGVFQPYYICGNSTGSNNLSTATPGGQIKGSDGTAGAIPGNIGEYVEALGNGVSSTVSFTIGVGGVAVVNWTAHGLSPGAAVNFTVSGTGVLFTGVTANVNYWVCGNVGNPIVTNSFDLSSNSTNAAGGTCDVTATATGTATQLGRAWAKLANGTPVDAVATSLSAGDWICQANADFDPLLVTTTITVASVALGLASTTPISDAIGSARWVGTAVTQAPNINSGPVRIQSSVGFNVFGVVQASIAGSMGAYGRISCRRAR